jgi:predicted DNA-binding WGR domain protein
MKRHFTFSDDVSNKFWQIETHENAFTVTYGRIGSAGQSQTKTFADATTCQKEAEKLIREKNQ